MIRLRRMRLFLPRLHLRVLQLPWYSGSFHFWLVSFVFNHHVTQHFYQINQAVQRVLINRRDRRGVMARKQSTSPTSRPQRIRGRIRWKFGSGISCQQIFPGVRLDLRFRWPLWKGSVSGSSPPSRETNRSPTSRERFPSFAHVPLLSVRSTSDIRRSLAAHV